MFEDSIDLTMVDEDELAARLLETAEFYLQTAIERDDVGAHRMVGQEVLGRSVRLKFLSLVRWLRQRTLDLDSFRESVNMKREWIAQVAPKRWGQTGFALHEWMAEQLILREFETAKQTYEKSRGKGVSSKARAKPEGTLYRVADSLEDLDDTLKHDDAEAALDKLYGHLTNWMAGTRSGVVLHAERLPVAYLRGKCFKGEEDPIRLIKRMKFGE
jgi:hypothetical protein